MESSVAAPTKWELSEVAGGINLLDATAKVAWPQNVLVSILGMNISQANSFVDICPEVLADISYVFEHVSVSQPDRELLLREFYFGHRTVSELATRHRTGVINIQRQLVELISCIRGSHLPSILTSGLRHWKQKQTQFRKERYIEQRDEPLWVLENVGVCETAWLQTIGISTVGGLVDAFGSDTGLQYDARYITEDAVVTLYKELVLTGVIENAEAEGVLVDCHVTPKIQCVKPHICWGSVDGTWPLNLWRDVMVGGGDTPPEDLNATVDAALRLLPPQQSMVLLLVYREGASTEAIGEKTGIKAQAVYAAKRRALEACREPHIKRLLQYGLSDCMWQDEEFKSASVSEMRMFPTAMLSLQLLPTKMRAEVAGSTVGEIADCVILGTQDANRGAAKQKKLNSLYDILQRAGVVQQYWAEGMDIQNPEHMVLTDKDVWLETFLCDLWEPMIKAQGGIHNVRVPADIIMRIHYAMGSTLSEKERQGLADAYPVVTSRTGGIAKTETNSTTEATLIDVTIPMILAKLRAAPSLIPPVKALKEQRCAPRRKTWPINLLLQVFQCSDELTLREHVPEVPPDLEQAIDYIFKSRLTEANARIIRMYFQDGMTCRMVGATLNKSGSYIGTVLKATVENTLRTYWCKRYLSLGYVAAQAEEEAVRNNGAASDILSESIERLALPRRVLNALRRAGVRTVGEVADILQRKVPRIRGLGKSGELSVYEAMNSAGILKLFELMGQPLKRPGE